MEDQYGSDFITNGKAFESKLGSLFSLAHIILSQYDTAWSEAEGSGTKGLLNRFALQNIHNYDSITDNQAKDLDKYFSDYFGYRFGRYHPKGMDLSNQGFRSRTLHLHRRSLQGTEEGYEEHQLWAPV